MPDIEEVFALSQVKTWVLITKRIQKEKFTYSDWCTNPTLCIKIKCK